MFVIVFTTGVSMAVVSQLFSTSVSSIYVSLSKSNQGVYGCPFHVFSKVSVPTRISTDPGHGTRIDWVYSYFRMSWNIEAFLLCVFTFTKSPSGPPWNEGYRPKVHHETSVLEVPVQEQTLTQFYYSSTNTFITCSLYTVRRCRTSPGTPDLRVRLGCLQGSTQNGM